MLVASRYNVPVTSKIVHIFHGRKLNDHPDLAGMSDFHYQQAVDADVAYLRVGFPPWEENKDVVRALIARRDMHLKWHVLLNVAAKREDSRG